MTTAQGPPHLALEHRPKLWYELLTALGRQEGDERGKANGYLDAAALPEEGLERVEPLAFD